ncbi:hypothetical protein WICPIJ_007150 [Wickerhamomyces pijperi]|uniref:Uncharacterized protein n=1 Tax=Wickerhamomyces pijperi TaxID=599730 RepID=A0A9P8TKB1_WICPI|nr:hypothetical protein WICPIJ_007150 [Wickerhamomyces pijperi]
MSGFLLIERELEEDAIGVGDKVRLGFISYSSKLSATLPGVTAASELYNTELIAGISIVGGRFNTVDAVDVSSFSSNWSSGTSFRAEDWSFIVFVVLVLASKVIDTSVDSGVMQQLDQLMFKRSGPFTTEVPVVFGDGFGPPLTGNADVLIDGSLEFARGEDLVVVVVNNNAVEALVVEELVVKPLAQKSFNLAMSKTEPRGSFNTSNPMITSSYCGWAYLPKKSPRTSSTMDIDPHFQVVLTAPFKRLIQVLGLTLDIRVVVQQTEGPVPDRNTNHVQPCAGNRGEIVLGVPRGPMLFQSGLSQLLPKSLCVMVLINWDLRFIEAKSFE